MKECFALIDKLETEHSYKRIFQILEEHGSLTASEYADADGTIKKETYTEMTARARRFAGALKKAGVKKDSFVGIKLNNSPDWPIAYWGVLAAGANALLLDARAEKTLTVHLMKQAGANILLTDDNEEYAEFEKPDFKSLLAADEAEADGEFGHLTALCTSGTTGTSRVFAYDDEAMTYQLLNTRKIVDRNFSVAYGISKGQMKQLAFLPFHHIFGFMAVYMWYAFLSAAMVYPTDKSAAGLLETCRKHKVTHVYCVPLLWNGVANGIVKKAELSGGERKRKQLEALVSLSIKLQKNLHVSVGFLGKTLFKGIQKQLFGSDIRFLISGGGHILPGTLRIINGIGYSLNNGFGMTETGITSVNLSYDIKERIGGGVGKPFESIKYKVDENGEIFIGGKSLYSGQMIDGRYVPREGEWFPTGDIGSIRDNVLYIEGRQKEIIINSSGENIYPDELEDNFMNVPAAQLCITGVNRGGEYEDIALVLSVDEELTGSLKDSLISAVGEANEHLPMNKKITAAYVTSLRLPTVNGIKVQRSKIKEQIENGEFDGEELCLERYVPGASSLKEAEPEDEKYIKIKEEVRGIFAETLYMKPEQITDGAHFVTDLGGDSLAAIGIIAQLEEMYSVEIDDDDFANMTNVKAVAEKLYRELCKK